MWAPKACGEQKRTKSRKLPTLMFWVAALAQTYSAWMGAWVAPFVSVMQLASALASYREQILPERPRAHAGTNQSKTRAMGRVS